MSSITFLGTGSSPRVQGKGKDHRLQSSALVTIGRRSFLIDVTQDFSQQSKLLPRSIDAIFSPTRIAMPRAALGSSTAGGKATACRNLFPCMPIP